MKHSCHVVTNPAASSIHPLFFFSIYLQPEASRGTNPYLVQVYVEHKHPTRGTFVPSEKKKKGGLVQKAFGKLVGCFSLM